MTISDFSIHNVLRTYNKQFRIGKLIRSKKSSDTYAKSDAVEISAESKKIAFVKSMSAEIISNLDGAVSQEVVEKKVNEKFERFVREFGSEFSSDNSEFFEQFKAALIELF